MCERSADRLRGSPAFAKREDEVVPAALQSYCRLTELALGILAPGDRLVLASCSSRGPHELLCDGASGGGAVRAGLWLRSTAPGPRRRPPDPFPRGAYLKCLLATAP